MTGGIDAHVHLWTRATDPQPWIDPVEHAVIDRDFAVADLAIALDQTQQSRAVVVQSSNSAAETGRLLSIDDGIVAGVVGWTDLTAGVDAVEAAITEARRAARSRLVGIRHLAHIDADARWLLRGDVSEGLDVLARRGLCFDLVVRWWQLPHAAAVARNHPELTLVLDHLGGPPIGQQEVDQWATGLALLGAQPNVTAKISGLPSGLGTDHWTLEDVRPILDVGLASFGAARLMYGSDWPLVRLGGDAPRWREAVDSYVSELTASEALAINKDCAITTYGLEATR